MPPTFPHGRDKRRQDRLGALRSAIYDFGHEVGAGPAFHATPRRWQPVANWREVVPAGRYRPYVSD